MEKILLTGATGFLGGHLAGGLTKDGYTVRCLARKSSRMENLNRLNLNLEFAYGDLSDKESLIKATQGIKIVIHSASVQSSKDTSLFNRINIQGTQNLVEACEKKSVRKFVLISSVGASFHSLGYECLYGNSKLAQEEILKNSGMEWIILRPPFIIGKRGTRNLCKLIELIKKYPFVPILADKKIQPIYVGDVVDSVLKVIKLKKVNRLYTIAGRDIITMSEFVKIAIEELKLVRFQIKIPIRIFKIFVGIYEKLSKAPIVTVENLSRIDFDSNYNIEPAVKDFGFNPVSIREAIKLTVEPID